MQGLEAAFPESSMSSRTRAFTMEQKCRPKRRLQHEEPTTTANDHNAQSQSPHIPFGMYASSLVCCNTLVASCVHVMWITLRLECCPDFWELLLPLARHCITVRRFVRRTFLLCFAHCIRLSSERRATQTRADTRTTSRPRLAPLPPALWCTTDKASLPELST